MSKKIPLESTKRHVTIYDEDWEYLESRFGPRGDRPVGVSTVVRAILHQKIMAMRQAEIEARDLRARTKPFRPAGAIQSPSPEEPIDV